jgi:tRNA1(Val) A37 N6-methylase TrmN6
MTGFELTQSGRFLGGRLRLAQGQGGHRAGADAALLASATPRDLDGLLVDVGAGAGAVGLSAALLAPAARIGLVEIEPRACALARENIGANGLEGRAVVFEADLFDAVARRAVGLKNESAEAVLTNPPYLAQGRSRASPDARRALAHTAAAPLADWARAALALLASGGSFVMIHRADALAECLAAVEGRLGGIALLPIAPRETAAATRVLLRGVKGSKAPFRLCPPLVLHQADGAFTPVADAIFRGQAAAPF